MKIPCLERFHITVEPVLFFYMMAIFLEFSVLQNLMFTKLCLQDVGITDIAECKNMSKSLLSKVDAHNARWAQYHQVVMSTTSLLACLYIASWSDKFGRKLPMLIQPLGSVVASVSTIFSATYLQLDMGYILISSFFSGICGGSAALIANCFGYLSDISNPENRTKRLVILEAMLFIGGTVGFDVAGFLQKHLHFPYIFLIILVIHVLLMCYIVFILPDLEPQEKSETNITESDQSEAPSFKDLFSLQQFLGVLVTVFRRREHDKRPTILILLTTSLLLYFGIAVQSTLVYSYVKNEPLKWDATLYSYYSGLVFALEGFTLVVVMPLLYWKWNVPDTWIGLVGIASRVAGLFMLGISTTTAMMFGGSLFFMCSEICLPAIRSMLSKIVDCDEKGKILTFMTMLQTLSFLIGALGFNSLYIGTMNFFPGFAFELVAVLQAIAMILFVILHLRIKRNYVRMKELDEAVQP